MAYMASRLTIDKAGRIILPKAVRDEMNLSAGDALDVRTQGERITLQPVRSIPAMRKERGVWVFSAGEKLSRTVVDQTVRELRDERYRASLGEEP